MPASSGSITLMLPQVLRETKRQPHNLDREARGRCILKIGKKGGPASPPLHAKIVKIASDFVNVVIVAISKLKLSPLGGELVIVVVPGVGDVFVM